MHEQRREEARAAQVCLPGRQVTCKSTAWPWVQSRVWRNYMQSEHLCEQAGNAHILACAYVKPCYHTTAHGSNRH